MQKYIAARQPDKKTPGRAGCEVSFDKEREGTVRAVKPIKKLDDLKYFAKHMLFCKKSHFVANIHYFHHVKKEFKDVINLICCYAQYRV